MRAVVNWQLVGWTVVEDVEDYADAERIVEQILETAKFASIRGSESAVSYADIEAEDSDSDLDYYCCKDCG